MNEEEKIKLRIEKLKDEKENLKFGHSLYLNSYLTIIIFLATATIAIVNSTENLGDRIIILVIASILMFICNFIFNHMIKSREKKLVEKAKEIEKLYDWLLTQ